MRETDLRNVSDVAARVHPGFPERPDVFAERLALFSPGCFALAEEDRLFGYAISHPWRSDGPPALDTLIGALPDPADAYLLHDVALTTDARGSGAGSRIVALLAEAARTQCAPTMTLVAVNESAPFWRRHGFSVVADLRLAAKVASYGADARYMTRATPI